MIDAAYLKVCCGARIVSVTVIIAVGINGDGRRELFDIEIGTSEATPAAEWMHRFRVDDATMQAGFSEIFHSQLMATGRQP